MDTKVNRGLNDIMLELTAKKGDLKYFYELKRKISEATGKNLRTISRWIDGDEIKLYDAIKVAEFLNNEIGEKKYTAESIL